MCSHLVRKALFEYFELTQADQRLPRLFPRLAPNTRSPVIAGFIFTCSQVPSSYPSGLLLLHGHWMDDSTQEMMFLIATHRVLFKAHFP